MGMAVDGLRPPSAGLQRNQSAIRFSAELRQNDRRYNLEATNNIYLPGGRRVRGFVGIEPLVHPCP